MKGQPCGIMRIAKFKWPSRGRSSRLEQIRLSMRVNETRIILYFGREAWKLTESRLMQRNSMAGHIFFSWAMRIPSSEKTYA